MNVEVNATSSFRVSHRPILDLKQNERDEILVGGADQIAFKIGKDDKIIKFGGLKNIVHSDWITAVDFVDKNSLVTGDMYGKIFQWNTNLENKKPVSLQQHSGSITQIKKVHNKAHAIDFISSSYDGKMNIYHKYRLISHLSNTTCSVTENSVFNAVPILDFKFNMKYLINSNRNGSLNFFEFKTITNNFEKPVITINCHDGPVTNFLTGISGEDIDRGPLLPNENLILTAGKFDGIVRLFDLRLKSKGVGRMVPKDIIKDSSNISKFKGVTNVATVGVNDSTTTSNFGMTVGEEGKVFLMDLRNQSGVLKSYTIQSSGERCFPMQTNPVDRCCYSLKSVNNGLVSGWGNGKIYVNHIIKKEDMEIKIKDQQLTRDLLKEENYSEFKEFSGMKNAIRNISLSPNNNQVICSGDDGVIVKFNLEFSQ